ncbi:SDR family oxidoreductase [Mycobacterium vicinigordonae]|uniref:SDR family oxidoreductase n=2 Tax=Mycobacterium vicinigordonae TaxID=1719132 RepID=A0A7D6HU99_9MYCO|nr:SDR family oxidoreductase [Mycobacterium vicinigordonae]
MAGSVVLITGASRGIGREMALRVARDGARVALLAKTATPHPKLPGTLDETADAVRAAGGEPLPIVCDVRDEASVSDAVATVAEIFGGIDVVVNNAGAIDLRRTPELAAKHFGRLLDINVLGPYAVVNAAVGHLRNADNPHIVNVSPPVNLDPSWFAPYVGHTVGKYAESLLVLGWAAEFASIPIAVNALWPAVTVASEGMVAVLGRAEAFAQARSPRTMADALYSMIIRPAAEYTGNFVTDEQVLREDGVEDFSGYRLADREEDLTASFYLSSATGS